jgi:hypothetical protein
MKRQTNEIIFVKETAGELQANGAIMDHVGEEPVILHVYRFVRTITVNPVNNGTGEKALDNPTGAA